VLTNILADPINTYHSPYRASIVNEINGEKIRTLDDLAKALAQPAEQFVIRWSAMGRRLFSTQKPWTPHVSGSKRATTLRSSRTSMPSRRPNPRSVRTHRDATDPARSADDRGTRLRWRRSVRAATPKPVA
jgi:hypothetical protein